MFNAMKSWLPKSWTNHNPGGYRIGRLDRATKNNNPPARSGNASVADTGELMHRRMRDAYLNQPLTKRSTTAIRDLVVGCGIQAYADPIDYSFGWALDRRPKSDLMRALDYALESDEEFMIWANDPEQCDVQGRQTFAEMQGMTVTENCLVGETIFLKYNRRGGNSRVPFMLQQIEHEQIDTSMDRPLGHWGNRIIGGFEFDDAGREMGVWIYNAHPHDHMSVHVGRSTFVPRDRYLHPFRPHRPSQGIGASWLHAQGQPMIDRDKWFETELRAAVKGALLVLVAHLQNPAGNSLGIDDDDIQSSREIALGTSPMAAEVGLHEKVEMVESARPNPNAQPFFNMLDHDLAAACDLSYYSMTGKFHEANFGGFKGALMLENAQMEVIAEWLGKALVRPIRRDWNRMAASMGVFKTMTAAEINAERSRFDRFDIIGAGRFLIDADNETKADMAELRGGLSTLKIECASRNLHWIKVLRQISLENMLCDALGVRLDHGSGGGDGTGGNTRSVVEQLTDAVAKK